MYQVRGTTYKEARGKKNRQRAVRFSTAADWLGALSADRQALREKKKETCLRQAGGPAILRGKPPRRIGRLSMY